MTDLIRPGDSILFMKVGMHAQESLEEIIERKQLEIDRAGFAMWGYGGPTCHPKVVQPFAAEVTTAGRTIRLVMEPVNSHHAREPKRADEFSMDQQSWQRVPDEIDVLGSRYALCIANLRKTDEQLHLGATRVAVGPSNGKVGSEYVQRQIDKACLRVVELGADGRVAEIRLQADLVEPWSVFVR